jgi:hypothetical protein
MDTTHKISTIKVLIVLFLLSCFACCSKQALYLSEGKPTPTKLGHLTLQDSISQYGVTWTFSEKVPVGQFVNGDYYVVGYVKIVSITPKPENGRNGSVLNLPPNPSESGFDSRVSANRYNPTMRALLPIILKPGDSLISTISVKELGELTAPLRPSDKSISPVSSASVLTCIEKPLPQDAFRPSYCDRTQKIYLARNLNRHLLPKLPLIMGGLAHGQATPTPQEWSKLFQRPWLDVCFFGFDAPVEYMPNYGREIGRAVGIASLLLMLDFPPDEKEQLLINFIQYGIDLWGIVRAGYGGWPAHGGHGSGRKWPIIFAGIMLGDEEMQSPTKRYPDLKFGEDMQTMYGDGWTGAKALYAGHTGKDGLPGKTGWGAYERLHPLKWANSLGEDYRRCCTSVAWVGQALAARIMKAEKIWDHDAFFDYVDRWMEEDDTKAIEEIKTMRGWDYSANYLRQGQAWDPFVNQMWAKYRNKLTSQIGDQTVSK